MGGDAGMKLSVVMPAQNEEGSVGTTVEGVVAALEREEIDYEVVVVDDDSEDSTGKVVEAIGASNPRVLPPPARRRLGLRLRLPFHARRPGPRLPA
ncbi:MAG TPA: glycosyltransferase, partial [Solirubrobacterales bacterium]|nr:glycosyltransferase [Solirubrobacterales bacterium]